ncbi:hypothetical protein EON67_12325, partial [archaeon]
MCERGAFTAPSTLCVQIKRREAMETVLAEKVGRAIDPYRSLAIPYTAGTAKAASRGFTEEEDRFLICMLNVLGYGAWDTLRMEIRRAEQFRFNWFMKSRTPEELHRYARCMCRRVCCAWCARARAREHTTHST